MSQLNKIILPLIVSSIFFLLLIFNFEGKNIEKDVYVSSKDWLCSFTECRVEFKLINTTGKKLKVKYILKGIKMSHGGRYGGRVGHSFYLKDVIYIQKSKRIKKVFKISSRPTAVDIKVMVLSN